MLTVPDQYQEQQIVVLVGEAKCVFNRLLCLGDRRVQFQPITGQRIHTPAQFWIHHGVVDVFGHRGQKRKVTQSLTLRPNHQNTSMSHGLVFRLRSWISYPGRSIPSDHRLPGRDNSVLSISCRRFVWAKWTYLRVVFLRLCPMSSWSAAILICLSAL